MKEIILSFTLVLVIINLSAQEISVQIKVAGKKTSDYWIEVADRNCGAQSNGINSYGKYYSWSEGEKSAERKSPDAAAKACKEFQGGGHNDWRLPEIEEIWVLMKKCKTHPTYASLQSEQGDTTAIIYFPYAGMIEPNAKAPIELNQRGYFWSAFGKGGSALGVALDLANGFVNNPGIPKKSKSSVRCVRTIK
ncbi:MAG: DUF1566 domain-containing protein [Bacteroidales bacterium]